MFPFVRQPDPEEVTRRVIARLNAMTPQEKFQSLIDSGILTESGEVHERYRHAITPIRRVPDGDDSAAAESTTSED